MVRFCSCSHVTRSFVVCSFVLFGAVAGCGGGDTGYKVSGKVTFAGKPVPAGKIYFRPDGSKGNTGSTGYADIRDGVYDTSLAESRGAPAGAVVVMIEGNDPSAVDKSNPDVTTKPLFSGYETTAELPEADSTKDFDVPAEAAKGPTAPKGNNVIVP